MLSRSRCIALGSATLRGGKVLKRIPDSASGLPRQCWSARERPPAFHLSAIGQLDNCSDDLAPLRFLIAAFQVAPHLNHSPDTLTTLAKHPKH